MSLENKQFLKFILFMISPKFREKINTKEEKQQNEEKFKDPEIFQNLKIKAEEK